MSAYTTERQSSRSSGDGMVSCRAASANEALALGPELAAAWSRAPMFTLSRHSCAKSFQWREMNDDARRMENVGLSCRSKASMKRVGGARNDAITSVRSDALSPMTRAGESRARSATELAAWRVSESFGSAAPPACMESARLYVSDRVLSTMACCTHRSRYGSTRRGMRSVSARRCWRYISVLASA